MCRKPCNENLNEKNSTTSWEHTMVLCVLDHRKGNSLLTCFTYKPIAWVNKLHLYMEVIYMLLECTSSISIFLPLTVSFSMMYSGVRINVAYWCNVRQIKHSLHSCGICILWLQWNGGVCVGGGNPDMHQRSWKTIVSDFVTYPFHLSTPEIETRNSALGSHTLAIQATMAANIGPSIAPV